MTNGDRIRQMSDEELARALVNWDCEMCSKNADVTCDGKCGAGVLEWLKQEVDGDAE